MASPKRIAVAVVESAGHFLVGVRPEGVPLAGKHEFPGGKCQSDETPRSCAVRECREETGLLIVPREHLMTTTHEYAHGTVELNFWRCSLSPDVPDCAAASGSFNWVRRSKLSDLDFPEANAEVVSLLLHSETEHGVS